jgi:diguanylate cyclase (GGDEF)-like protein
MISLKKYLDSVQASSSADYALDEEDILPAALAAYRSALLEMGSCSLNACPALGEELKSGLGKLESDIALDMSREEIEATDKDVQRELQGWGLRTARHYQRTAGEVKELLIAMARTAESVGQRDQRCAGQINEVTARLQAIASLEDLTEIRASIEKSAAELRSSVERMTLEGKAAIDQLQKEVSSYQTKLEDAEEIASRDALTGLRSRLCVENQIERRIGSENPFCAAIIDIDGFKKVNDDHGHLTGDELLKQFATELRSACRSTDLIGRWGGDEFIILLDYALPEANIQTDRLMKWVCGNYTVQAPSGPMRLRVDVSIGLAEHIPGETMNDLLARADAAMYQHKAISRTGVSAMKR